MKPPALPAEAGVLPPGWIVARLDELGTWTGGGTPSKATPAFWEGSIPWVSPKDMKALKLDDTRDHVSEAAVRGSATKLFEMNSLAFVVRSGILEHTLPISLIRVPAAANQDLKVLTPTRELNPEWLLYALLAQAEAIRRSCRKDGTTVASIDFPKLKRFPLLVPPRPEQNRIVEAVEAAIEATADAELDVGAAAAKTRALEASRLAVLLDEGDPVLVGDLLRGIEAGKSFRCDPRRPEEGEWGVIKVSAMTWGRFDPSESKTVLEDQSVNPSWEIRPGDVLLSRANTSGLVGASVLVEDSPRRLLLSDKSLRLQPIEGVLPAWLQLALSTMTARQQISALATGNQDSMRNISQAKLRSVVVKKPPPDRQEAIVEEARQFRQSVADLGSSIEQQSARAGDLRRAILRNAFAGQLLPQDLRDEPASELLKRAKASGAAA